MQIFKMEDVKNMNETTVKMTIEITVNDEVTMDKLGKPSNKVTMGEYRDMLYEALEEAPFSVNVNF